jgi:hypothetical protein
LVVAVAAPIEATTSWLIAIPTAPYRVRERRPIRSVAIIPTTVMPVLTTLVAMVMRNGFEIPELVKKDVP